VGGVKLLEAGGVNGFTVPTGDTAGFAAALRQLVQDPALRLRMGAASRERVAAFTIPRMIAGVLAVYACNEADRSFSKVLTPIVR
jgi:glycosyltransferase involved in cell wall biosynthesis